MITIFMLLSGFFVITKVVPFLFKITIAITSLFFEIVGFVFLFTSIGFFGILIFFVIDFIVLKLIMQLFIA